MERKRRTIEGISAFSQVRAQVPRTADLIYQALHGDIVSMRLRPGDKISEQDLATHFNVSRTPVRQALAQLSNEGLVTVFPQAGTFVARIPVRLLMESIMIRKALETVVVEAVVARVTPDDIARLDDNMQALEDARLLRDFQIFNRADSEFHRLLGQMSGLNTVVATTEHVRVQIDRYRLLTLPQDGRLQRVVAEHRAVRDAIVAGDTDAAGRLMGHHIGQMLAEVAALDQLDAACFHDDRQADDAQITDARPHVTDKTIAIRSN